jgi:hypothetical protein
VGNSDTGREYSVDMDHGAVSFSLAGVGHLVAHLAHVRRPGFLSPCAVVRRSNLSLMWMQSCE